MKRPSCVRTCGVQLSACGQQSALSCGNACYDEAQGEIREAARAWLQQLQRKFEPRTAYSCGAILDTNVKYERCLAENKACVESCPDKCFEARRKMRYCYDENDKLQRVK